jgi:hypothetical protein
MPVSKANSAARDAAAAIPELHRAAQCRRDRPGARAHLDDVPVGIVSHHDTARIACQAL